MIKEFVDWMKKSETKFEVIKFLKNREFACIVPRWCDKDMQKRSTRNLKVHSVQHLDFVLFKILNVETKETVYNLYYSLAKYKNGIPNQNPDLSKRDNTDWNKNCWREIESYDWLVDIDAGNHKEMGWAFDTAKSVKELFDKLGVPYELRFSGCGFHFLVPNSYFEKLNLSYDPHRKGSYFNLYTAMARGLSERFSEMIDWNINDSRRVCKLPYTLAIYEDETYLCYPFGSDKEFNSWELKDSLAEKWDGRIRGRGTFLFNENFGDCDKLLDDLVVVLK